MELVLAVLVPILGLLFLLATEQLEKGLGRDAEEDQTVRR